MMNKTRNKAIFGLAHYPQIYINQEFIGGFDILKDMAESGDFEQFLKEKNKL